MKRQAGFTLIELMVAVAVAAVLLMLAAPSFKDMILMQRLRGVSAELVTDIQFARSEAVARRDLVRIEFKSDVESTCYTIYTAPTNSPRCDCLLGPGAACTGNRVEIKTVKLAKSIGILISPPSSQLSVDSAFAFDWRTGGIFLIPTDRLATPVDAFLIDSYIDRPRKLRTRVGASGRPQVCTPTGSSMSEPAC